MACIICRADAYYPREWSPLLGWRIMSPFCATGRWIRIVSLAGYLLSGLVATLAHDHGGSGCCSGPYRRSASAAPATSTSAKRRCKHAFCKRHTQTKVQPGTVSSERHDEPSDSGSLSTRCAACEFLAQRVATPAQLVTTSVSFFRWHEAPPLVVQHDDSLLSAFLARGPPA